MDPTLASSAGSNGEPARGNTSIMTPVTFSRAVSAQQHLVRFLLGGLS